MDVTELRREWVLIPANRDAELEAWQRLYETVTPPPQKEGWEMKRLSEMTKKELADLAFDPRTPLDLSDECISLLWER